MAFGRANVQQWQGNMKYGVNSRPYIWMVFCCGMTKKRSAKFVISFRQVGNLALTALPNVYLCLFAMKCNVLRQLICAAGHCTDVTVTGSTDSMQTRRSQVGNEVQLRFLVDTVKNEATRGNAIVIVMRRFERFTARRKQTLLYNLFDLTQCPDVRIAIVGLSTFHNVTDDFEKRILVSNGFNCGLKQKSVISNSPPSQNTVPVSIFTPGVPLHKATVRW